MAEIKKVEDILEEVTFEDEDDDDIEEKDYDLEGFLQKRQGNNKAALGPKEKTIKWSLRYFILKGGTLHCYQNATDVDPKNSFDLEGAELDLQGLIHINQYAFAIKKEKLFLILASSSEEDLSVWVDAIKVAISKPSSKPPKRVKKKSAGLAATTKKVIGAQVITSTIGRSILKEMMTPDTWLVINNIKTFITKESGEKVAKEMLNEILKFVVQVHVLCKENLLTPESFWIPIKNPMKKAFHSIIDSLELSFALDPEGLATKIQELEKAFEKVFGPLVSTKSIAQIREIFQYWDTKRIRKFYTDEKYTEEVTSIVRTLRKLWNDINFPERA